MAPKECYDGADVVLAPDIADFEGPTHVRDIATRTVVNTVPETATWIDIGFTDVEVSKWSMDYGRTFHAHHRMTADPVIGTTQLVALLQERIGRNADPDRPPHLEREAGYGHRHLVPVLLGFFAPRCP
jgi:acetolactate synthase I/II/III large subunit